MSGPSTSTSPGARNGPDRKHSTSSAAHSGESSTFGHIARMYASPVCVGGGGGSGTHLPDAACAAGQWARWHACVQYATA
jgi:hypothetical protein